MTGATHSAEFDPRATSGPREVRLVGWGGLAEQQLRRRVREARAPAGARVVLDLEGAGPVDPAALERLVEDGVQTVALRLHSDRPSVHDALAACEGDHVRLAGWLKVASALPVDVVVDVPLWSRSLQRVEKVVEFVARCGGSRARVIVGLADRLPLARNADRAIPGPLPDLGRALANVVAEFCPSDRSVVAALPVCSVFEPPEAASRAEPAWIVGSRGGRFAVACQRCAARSRCGGLPGWYLDAHGESVVRPIDRSALADPSATSRRPPPPQAASVDLERAEERWSGARSALEAGESDVARRLALEALGFELGEHDPVAEGAGAGPAPGDGDIDDASLIVEGAVRAAGYDRIEEVAFAAGLKPVLYLTVQRADLQRMRDRYDGFSVEVVGEEPDEPLARGVSRRHAHLFVGRNRADATAVADVYRAGDPTAQAVDVGALMGYPRCCTQAFADAADNRSDSGNVYRVAARTERPGHPLLNLGVVHVVPFYPCTFDCAAGARYAEVTLDALCLDAAGGVTRERVLRALDRPTLYFDKTRSVVFAGTRDGDDVEYERFRALVRSPSPGRDAALMERSIGALLSRAIRLATGPHEWVFTLRGGAPGERRLNRWSRAPGILLPFGSAAERVA